MSTSFKNRSSNSPTASSLPPPFAECRAASTGFLSSRLRGRTYLDGGRVPLRLRCVLAHRSTPGRDSSAEARGRGDTSAMLERFDEGARRSVALAEEEARALNHDYLGTEHLLLGLLAEGKGVAAAALTELGASADAGRAEVARVVGRGPSPADLPKLPFTPRAKKVLELALREALQLSDRSIRTEHLLLGVVREGQGVAVQVLTAIDVDTDRLRSSVLRLREAQPPALTIDGRLDAIDSTLQRMLRQQDAIMTALRGLADPPPHDA